MWKWLERKRALPERAQTELRGAPRTVRQKTYSAETGYVYQYVYRGYEEVAGNKPGRVFAFKATRDRARYFEVRIMLFEEETAGATASKLSNAELYAVAKMTLFGAFDTYGEVGLFDKPLTPDAAAIRGHLTTLGRL